jgi:hypothetical protein
VSRVMDDVVDQAEEAVNKIVPRAHLMLEAALE